MGVIEYQGWVVDDATGEIMQEGGDLDALVHAAHSAEQQIKSWEKIAAMLKANVMTRQGEKRATYGRLVARIVEGTYPVLDAPRWKIDIAEGLIPPEAHADLLSYAKTFDRAKMPAPLAGLVENYTNHPARKPFVQIEVQAQRAPVSQEEQGDE